MPQLEFRNPLRDLIDDLIVLVSQVFDFLQRGEGELDSSILPLEDLLLQLRDRQSQLLLLALLLLQPLLEQSSLLRSARHAGES